MTSKKPTPQAISSLLRREGFAKAEPIPQRGLHRRGRARLTDGYKVSRGAGCAVEVRFWVGHKDRPAADAGALMFYAEKIRAAGYAADYGDRLLTYLVVTAKEDADA